MSLGPIAFRRSAGAASSTTARGDETPSLPPCTYLQRSGGASSGSRADVPLLTHDDEGLQFLVSESRVEGNLQEANGKPPFFFQVFPCSRFTSSPSQLFGVVAHHHDHHHQ